LSIGWIPGNVISGFIFNKKYFEAAKLKLAIVKRNFNFMKFHGDLTQDPCAVISEFRRPDELQEAYLKRLGVIYAQEGPFFGGRAAEFGFFDRFITIAQEYWGTATSEILDLLHPAKDEDDLSPRLAKGLPLLFYSPGIEEHGRAHGMVVDVNGGKLCYRRSFEARMYE
jgi:hypothetical protein